MSTRPRLNTMSALISTHLCLSTDVTGSTRVLLLWASVHEITPSVWRHCAHAASAFCTPLVNIPASLTALICLSAARYETSVCSNREAMRHDGNLCLYITSTTSTTQRLVIHDLKHAWSFIDIEHVLFGEHIPSDSNCIHSG
jgi:hypothetical protein